MYGERECTYHILSTEIDVIEESYDLKLEQLLGRELEQMSACDRSEYALRTEY